MLSEAGDSDLDARAATYLSHPLLQKQPHRPTTAVTHQRHPDDVQDQALSDAIITDPGQAPLNYSNSNYLLLGMLIETVTGLAADDVHRDVLAGGNSRFAIQDTGAHSPPMAAPELTGTGKPPHHRNTKAFGRLHRPASNQSGISAATTLVVVIENSPQVFLPDDSPDTRPGNNPPHTGIDAEVT